MNTRREDILKEFYRLKLLPIRGSRKEVHDVMGKDGNAWYVYHKLCSHHTEDCHHLKREIEILIQKGSLLSYVNDVRGHPGKRSHPNGDISSKNPLQKKGKNTGEVHEAQVTCHTLNSIVRGFK